MSVVTPISMNHGTRELEQLREEIVRLRRRKEELEDRSAIPTQAAAIALAMHRIAQMTEQLLQGPVTFESLCDPSEPDETWLEVRVATEGSYADSEEIRKRWYEEVKRIVPDSSVEFRLSLVPRS
jgi:hypothetical protein